MRVFMKCLLAVGVALGVSGVANAVMEPGIDRKGGDYTNVTLPPGSGPQTCENLCNADAPCKAWTYVNAGVQAPNPRCWLKNTIPAAVSSGCCTSGVKLPGVESDIDRPGNDYTNVTLPPGTGPQLCQSLCYADIPCKAWTYVNAGIQAPNPRCWLKNTVPTPQANSCCTSGVK
jgi:hypothetical protein